jgi:hypothetical protein
MEEASENGKKLLRSAHGSGMNCKPNALNSLQFNGEHESKQQLKLKPQHFSNNVKSHSYDNYPARTRCKTVH